jgi:DNA repair photolyase
MSEVVNYIPYQPRAILNTHRHPDHWFWSKYTAHAYSGCQHGCAFCYTREEKYSPYESPDEFSRTIKVKENAPELLRKALSRKPVDLVFTCDYQPAERKFGLSRKMLEVCRDLGFPVFILERSPLVTRDLDILCEINNNSPSVSAFSIISTPDSPHHAIARKLENNAPSVESRFAAMKEIADAGILTGACFMPILPGICDDDANLEAVVRWTAEHGGKFILAGGLTLADQQKSYFLNILQREFPDMVEPYQRWYPEGSYAAVNYNWNGIAVKIRELCRAYGIKDRVPRPIIPGDKMATNKRTAEILADKCYDLDIHNKPQSIVWAYRKAAWAVEEFPTDIRLVYRSLGVKGIQGIKDIGEKIGFEVEAILDDLMD